MKKIFKFDWEKLNVVEWLGKPTLMELVILYFFLGINVAIATDAVVSLSYIKIVYFSVLMVTAVVIIRLFIFALTIRSKFKPKCYPRWLLLGMMAIAMALITGTNLGLSVRVWLSEKSLLKEIQFIQSLSQDGQKQMLKQEPQPIGLFNLRLYEVDNQTGTVWFHTANGRPPFPPPYSLLGGIVYKNQGHPPERGETTYEHLFGPWWRWLQDI